MTKYIRAGVFILTGALTYLTGCRVTERDFSKAEQEPVFRTSALMDLDNNYQLDSIRIEEKNLVVLLRKGSKYQRKVIGKADRFDVMDVDGDGRLDIILQEGNTNTIFRQTTPGEFERSPK